VSYNSRRFIVLIHVISKWPHASCSSDFETTHTILSWIAQVPLTVQLLHTTLAYLESFKDKLYINLTLECDVVHHKIQGFCFKHSWQQLIPNKEKTKMISYNLETAAAQGFPSNQNACNFFQISCTCILKSYKAKIFHWYIWSSMKHKSSGYPNLEVNWIWHLEEFF